MKKVMFYSCVLAVAWGCGTNSKRSNSSNPDPKEPTKTEEPGKKTPPPVKQKKEDAPKKPASQGNQQATENQEESKKPVALTCEDQWVQYTEVNEAGEFLKYHIVSKSNFSGTETVTETDMIQEVESTSDSSVKWQNETIINGASYPSPMEIFKETYIEGCKNSDVEIIDSGEETIEVKAGEYETKWTETKTDFGGTITTSKVFMAKRSDGDSFVVKSESETVMEAGSSTSTMELVDTNK